MIDKLKRMALDYRIPLWSLAKKNKCLKEDI